MKKQLSPYIFSCQYHNDPIDEQTQDFKSEWIQWWDISDVRKMMAVDGEDANDADILKKWYSTLNKYMVCDPNRTVKKRSDYTAITVAGVDMDNKHFVLEYVRKKMRAPEIITSFCDMYIKWNPLAAKIEVVGGDEHLYPLIKNEMKKRERETIRIKELITQRNINKEDRIRNLQPSFENKLWYLREGMSDLEMELLRFPHAKHDDLIETLAYLETQCIKDMKKVDRTPKDKYHGYRNRLKKTGARGWLTA